MPAATPAAQHFPEYFQYFSTIRTIIPHRSPKIKPAAAGVKIALADLTMLYFRSRVLYLGSKGRMKLFSANFYEKSQKYFTRTAPACRRCQDRGGRSDNALLSLSRVILGWKEETKNFQSRLLRKLPEIFYTNPAPACRRCHVRVVSYYHARLFPRDCKIIYWRHFLSVSDSFFVDNLNFTLRAPACRRCHVRIPNSIPLSTFRIPHCISQWIIFM